MLHYSVKIFSRSFHSILHPQLNVFPQTFVYLLRLATNKSSPATNCVSIFGTACLPLLGGCNADAGYAWRRGHSASCIHHNLLAVLRENVKLRMHSKAARKRPNHLVLLMLTWLTYASRLTTELLTCPLLIYSDSSQLYLACKYSRV